jgi:hypothetical protein
MTDIRGPALQSRLHETLRDGDLESTGKRASGAPTARGHSRVQRERIPQYSRTPPPRFTLDFNGMLSLTAL